LGRERIGGVRPARAGDWAPAGSALRAEARAWNGPWAPRRLDRAVRGLRRRKPAGDAFDLLQPRPAEGRTRPPTCVAGCATSVGTRLTASERRG